MKSKYSNLLGQNHPNPFNPVTNIRFELPKQLLVKLTVYNVAGKEVAVLFNGNLKAGAYNYDWDASNYTSGVYFYRLETEAFEDVKKMVLLK